MVTTLHVELMSVPDSSREVEKLPDTVSAPDRIRLYGGVGRTSLHRPLQVVMSDVQRPFPKCSSEEGELLFGDDLLGREKY